MSATHRQLLTVGVVALVVGAGLVAAGGVLGDAGAVDDPAQLSPDEPGGKTITVSASGTAEAEPDRAVVRVSVEATADDPTVARRRVAENASAMREALTSLGLAEEAVRTVGFDIYEDRVRPPTPEEPPREVYRARHTVAIDVDDTDAVGEVIDAAVEHGATSVHGVEFTLAEDTRRELRRAAIEEAMGDARARADAVAAGGDVAVTGVHAVRTGGLDRGRPIPVLQGADGGAGRGTAIESGPVSVTATVTVTYNATG